MTLVLPIFFTGLVPAPVRVAMLPTLVGVIAVNLYSLRWIKRRERLTYVGYQGVVIDVMLMCLVPFNLYLVDLGSAAPVLITKTHFPVICGMLIALNATSTRPIYPLLATGGAVLSHMALLVASLGNSTTPWTTDMREVLTGGGVAPHIFGLQLFFLTAGGLALTAFNRTVRRTVVEAAHTEAERARERERQAQTIMDAKMDALVRLVAGVSHEVNTPLGSVRSSLATQKKALAKLQDMPADAPAKKRERMLRAAVESVTTGDDAIERIGAVVDKLARFARVDEAAYKSADVSELLSTAASLVPHAARDGVELVYDGSEAHVIECFPSGLSQVFLTLLTNAFEAVDGSGEVRVTVEGGENDVVIDIADDGRGMGEDELATLFDVQLGRAGERVAAAFGLPICQTVIRQHGGTIAVKSTEGTGTTFTLTVPRAAIRRSEP